MELKEGELLFDETTGQFTFVSEDGIQRTLNFNEEFEVQVGNEWVKTGFQIGSDDNGDMIFKLRGTSYAGVLDGLIIRM